MAEFDYSDRLKGLAAEVFVNQGNQENSFQGVVVAALLGLSLQLERVIELLTFMANEEG